MSSAASSLPSASAIFRYAEHAPNVTTITLDSEATALSVLNGGRPVVLRGLLPKSKSWLPDAALDGDESVRLDINPLHENSAPVKLPNRTQVRPAERFMTLREATALLRRSPATRGFHAYSQQIPLSGKPVLTKALPLQRALYLASKAAQLVSVNFWLGDGGLRSALHYDPHDNLLVQLRGAKTLLLLPPSVSEGFGLFAPYAERRYAFDDGVFSGTYATGDAPIENHATVDVFASDDDDDDDDEAAAAAPDAALRSALREHALIARLRAGEALFLPALWSHAVQSHVEGGSSDEHGSQRSAADPGASSERLPALNAAMNLWFLGVIGYFAPNGCCFCPNAFISILLHSYPFFICTCIRSRVSAFSKIHRHSRR